MISGRLFVLKSKMNTTYLFWFKVLMCFCFMVYSLALVVFLSLLRIKYRYKSRWLNYNVDLFVLNLWESKAILQAFSIRKLNIHKS
jgi:hypothetical protein